MLVKTMKIPKDNITNSDFYVNPSIDNLTIDEIELDLSSKQNVFSNSVSKNINQQKNEKSTNTIKRLNIFDNYFLQDGQVPEENSKNSQLKKSFISSDSKQVFKSMQVAFKGVLERVPVINYFVLRDKQNKIKETIKTLSTINNDMDELIRLSYPYGESDKYKMLSETIIKANNIHSRIKKEISPNNFRGNENLE